MKDDPNFLTGLPLMCTLSQGLAHASDTNQYTLYGIYAEVIRHLTWHNGYPPVGHLKSRMNTIMLTGTRRRPYADRLLSFVLSQLAYPQTKPLHEAVEQWMKENRQ